MLWILVLSVIVCSQVWIAVRWAVAKDREEHAQATLLDIIGRETWDDLMRIAREHRG